VQEISTWTWRKADGSAYAPPPSLWRRVADRSPEAAQFEFGSLTAPADGEFFANDGFVDVNFIGRDHWAGWSGLHRSLAQVAALWVPEAKTPGLFALDTFRLPRDEVAERLRIALGAVAMEGEIAPRLKDWRLELKPMSLRAALLMGVASDIEGRARFRRCSQCREWFAVARSDARFCSDACRTAHHAHKKET
jgi:hypothetical protein